MEPSPRLVIGLDCSTTADATASLGETRPDGYDFIVTSISSSKQIRTDSATLDSKWWRTAVVGSIELLSEIEDIVSLTGFMKHCLEWSAHMNLPAVLLPRIGQSELLQQHLLTYAATLTRAVIHTLRNDTQLWIPIGLQEDDTELFDCLHRTMSYSNSVHVCLILEDILTGDDVPVRVADLLRRLHLWVGRVPIAAILIPTSIFLINKRGFPTLSRAHQMILSTVIRRVGRTLKVLIKPSPDQTSLLPDLTTDQLGESRTMPYVQYLQHFRNSRTEISQVLDCESAKLETDYLDHLQSPLQPLADHLENATYEVFEKDPVKYARYQRAVELALKQDAETHMQQDTPYIIIVAGAGRGPLVSACLRALQEVSFDRACHIYAVEKNPSAVSYLRSKLQFSEEWNTSDNLSLAVTVSIFVVQSDLRRLHAKSLFGNADHRANLIVSELLGSFGCNELSPECLDALFHQTDVCSNECISIPSRYVSHAAPVSSIKLHQAILQQALHPHDTQPHSMLGYNRAVETPYVVRPHAASQVHKALDCWTFEHPSLSTNPLSRNSRERAVNLQFPSEDPTYAASAGSGYPALDDQVASLTADLLNKSRPLSWICTGLLGTFTADLFKSSSEYVQISTVPQNFSDGMFSWFPLYFPLHEPVRVPAGAAVQAQIWRCVDDKKVWYEWSLQVIRGSISTNTTELLYASPLYNPGGRSYSVAL